MFASNKFSVLIMVITVLLGLLVVAEAKMYDIEYPAHYVKRANILRLGKRASLPEAYEDYY
ncbi:hypothetical protein Ciccas_010497 [Cichlidogyrus casuarinus]|uniref:Uncharacterized protein n=1 Tax=Cichlidogyrus casuarinus TaxID=1844966 RepID=A0ABD2PUI5_9PLAT